MPAHAKREEDITGRYLRRLRNQNGEHIVYILNILEAQVNEPKLYFLLKVAENNIKIKITHRVVGDGCIWEKTSLMNTVSVSQCYMKF